MIKAVIFDLDGTIVYSHPLHFKAYEELFKEFGITWSYEEFEKVFAGTGARSIVENILKREGVTEYNLDEEVEKKRKLFAAILRGSELRVVPGFFEFVKEINARGMKKIIASGSHEDNIWDMLEEIGARKEFTQVVSTDGTGRPKPYPDVFLKAASLLEVHPSDCLVLEDSRAGVMAAKAAAMKCIAFTTTIDEDTLKTAGADLVVADYTKIPLPPKETSM